jgi:hypothetical protein
MKNVGIDGAKPLKMQKMIVIEILAMMRYMNYDKDNIIVTDDRIMAMNFRLI